MEKLSTKNKILMLIVFSIMLFMIIGLGYAYFALRITGKETDTTITAESGIMRINYNGGPEINVSNIFPSNNPFATKNFTVAGTNTSEASIYYNLSIVVESNTFNTGSLQYVLTSVNTDNNGIIVPSVLEMTNIESGSGTTFLGNGSFTSSDTGQKIHTYRLDLSLPITGGHQLEDQGKLFKGYIQIKEGKGYSDDWLSTKILAQYGGQESIIIAPTILFNSTSTNTENDIYKMEDDYGTSYYYRGAKDYVNNNLIFANQQWKVVRINGDGSIRIVHNGSCPDNLCLINKTGESTMTVKTKFNQYTNDAKYLGYMFGGTGGVASTSKEQATTNETNSSIKTVLDEWYVNNILYTEYEDYLSDTLFCNDRQLQSEIVSFGLGNGFGAGEASYASGYRVHTLAGPNLKCGLKNDRFTVNDSLIGNSNLTYPIGTLAFDEVSLAGMKSITSNNNNYLLSAKDYFTMGSAVVNVGSYAGSGVGIVGDDGALWSANTNYELYARAVLNLKFNVKASGTGSSDDPFVIITDDYPNLADSILAQYGGAEAIIEAPTSLFSNASTSTENKMYKFTDDYGPSYYYRGAKSYINNNLIFANHQWKIIRINGDGSVRILYNGTCPNNNCTINVSGASTTQGVCSMNTYANDAKYVGYMYGGSSGAPSTSREQATAADKSSSIKTQLDFWYTTNIKNLGYQRDLSDTLFCNDRQLRSEAGGPATGTGFGLSETIYAPYYRLAFLKSPTLKCGLKNDRFTVKDTVLGNGSLVNPIGLLTPDETVFAGLDLFHSNEANFLINENPWWLSGSTALDSSGDALGFTVESDKVYPTLISIAWRIRGVLNLKPSTQVVGDGSAAAPFKVMTGVGMQ